MMPRLGVCFGCAHLPGCSTHARLFYHHCLRAKSFGVSTRRLFATLNRFVPMVSSVGRIEDTRGVISWGHLNAAGYYMVRLSGRNWRVHRLVARAFLGRAPSPNHCNVAHKDGDRTNNNLTNLEYRTLSECMHDFHRRYRSRHHMFASSKPVLVRVSGSTEWSFYPSMAEAARQLKVPVALVRIACHSRPTHVQGFEVKLANPRATDSEAALPNEEWRNAVHPTTHAPLAPLMVSSSGRVSSARVSVGRGSLTNFGYMRVQTRLDGSSQQHYVHRLVAAAFLGPPPDEVQVQVNHKDGNRANNHVDNLEYVTGSQNVKHSYSSGARRSSAQAQSKPVWAEHVRTKERIWYPSGAEAARQLGLNQGNISLCCHGVCGRAGEYSFSFAAPAFTKLLPGEEWREVVFDI